MENLKERFKKQIKPDLQKTLGLKNPMRVPRLMKIVVNMGVKDAILNKKNLETGIKTLTQITGQRPKTARARKSISGFKLREGDTIGLMVTLHGRRMYDFFERLVTIVLPRLRDFRGLSSKSFDGHGNYTLGFSESTVFPEIDPGKIDKIQGFEVSFITSAKKDKEGLELLKAMGMPFGK